MNIGELRERIRQWKAGELTPGGYEETDIAVESTEVAADYDAAPIVSSSEEVSAVEPSTEHQEWATGASPAPSSYDVEPGEAPTATEEHFVEDAYQQFAEQEMLAADQEQPEQAEQPYTEQPQEGETYAEQPIDQQPQHAEQPVELAPSEEQPVEQEAYAEQPVEQALYTDEQQVYAEQPEQEYAEQPAAEEQPVQPEQAEYVEQFVAPEQEPQVQFAPQEAGDQPMNHTVPGYPQIDQSAVAGESPVPLAPPDDEDESGTSG